MSSADLATPFDAHLHDDVSPMRTAEPSAVADVLVFTLAERRFAIATRELVQATTQLTITPVPSAPSDVLGIALVNGRVATVLRLSRVLLGSERAETPRRWLVVENGEEILALGVDGLAGIVSVRELDVRPHVAALDGQATTPFAGYVDDSEGALNILDLPRLIAALELGGVGS